MVSKLAETGLPFVSSRVFVSCLSFSHLFLAFFILCFMCFFCLFLPPFSSTLFPTFFFNLFFPSSSRFLSPCQASSLARCRFRGKLQAAGGPHTGTNLRYRCRVSGDPAVGLAGARPHGRAIIIGWLSWTLWCEAYSSIEFISYLNWLSEHDLENLFNKRWIILQRSQCVVVEDCIMFQLNSMPCRC
ncbi:hypothetical protein B0J18DRAFT_212947 [Chaetomium sp. MPI-SDFR-AT-0129]|nr:hypothetical protein B0J18DRAFT_212947 [Chaetomium sp. MPI-SDFR-AT-0129]